MLARALLLLSLAGVAHGLTLGCSPRTTRITGQVTIEKSPSTLPESWTVPDTFTFPPQTQKEEAPLYRVTLFRSSSKDVGYIVESLM